MYLVERWLTVPEITSAEFSDLETSFADELSEHGLEVKADVMRKSALWCFDSRGEAQDHFLKRSFRCRAVHELMCPDLDQDTPQFLFVRYRVPLST